jgi:hypothetical protein
MTKVSIHRLVQIYKDNMVLEGEGTIKGNKAKLLINRCKQALKIIQKDYDEKNVSEKLEKNIEQMEDSLAKHGEVRSIDYNLDARVMIHMVIVEYNLFQVKDGWQHFWNGDDWSYHWLSLGDTVCGHKGEESNSQPSWHMMRKHACEKCIKYLLGLLQKEYDQENLKEGTGVSGSAYGIRYHLTKKGKVLEDLKK